MEHERALPPAYDHELTLVEGAFALVGSGAAPSVTLVGLTGGAQLAALAIELGRRAGLSVQAWQRPSRRPGDRRIDLLVLPHG